LYFKKKELLRKQKENKKNLAQVFELAAAGKTVKQIARAMRIEHGTVYLYLRNAPHSLALARLHKEHPDIRWNPPRPLSAEEKQKIHMWEQEFSDTLAPLERKKNHFRDFNRLLRQARHLRDLTCARQLRFGAPNPLRPRASRPREAEGPQVMTTGAGGSRP
jgi:transposase